MKGKPSLISFKVKNFKAVQDSKTIRFTPLTVFIGNNGSGKSSIVEGLETLQTLALHGLDVAMQAWHGFEYIWNRSRENEAGLPGKGDQLATPIVFSFQALSVQNLPRKIRIQMEISADSNFDKVFFQKYKTSYRSGKLAESPEYISNGQISDENLKVCVEDWQFLRLVPQFMTEPIPQKRTLGRIRLNKDGSNIAEYLQSIRDQDVPAFNGIVEALKVVLPFAIDLQPVITSELERKVYLALSEERISQKLPSWLISTGTLRILALLALLRAPNPPPVIIIEEIENGLDPRTIHLLVDEIQYFVESGRGQVIFTTHSPYLLDLLPLSSLILVERIDGEASFTRPADQKGVQDWAKRFSPGQLYTSNRLSRRPVA
jgi:predicted ATPase